jgi:hypothetical protein
MSHPIRVGGRASPPGGRRPSFLGAWAPVVAGLRGRSWVWWLAGLWVVIGAGGAIYATALVNHITLSVDFYWMLQWNGEAGVIIAIGAIAEVAWALLSLPVLIGGFVQLRGWRPRNWLRVAGWAILWMAGMVLMNQAADWAIAGENGTRSDLSVGELAICAGWLALGGAMTWILSTPQTQADSSSDSNVATH